MRATCLCGRELCLDDRFAGLTVRCPFCKQLFEAPVPTAAAAGEPDVIDLAPANPPEPSPRRPRRRPRREADPEEIEEIRRKIIRPFSWSRPATWRFRLLVDAIAIGMLGVSAFAGLILLARTLEARPTDTATPQRISLEQLLRHGPGDNSNVIVTDFVPSPHYVYIYSRKEHEVVTPEEAEQRHWDSVWVPLVPLTAETEERLARGDELAEEFEPSRIRAVVRLSNVHDKVSAGQWIRNAAEIRGVVSRRSFGKIPEEMTSQYPQTDFSACLVIREGETAPTWTEVVILSIIGAVTFFLGGLWFLFRFVRRQG